MDRVIERMGRSFQLTVEENEKVVVPDGLWSSILDQHQLVLVGWLLSTHPFNFEGLCRSVQGMMNPVKGMEITQLPTNRLLLQFYHVIDRNRALDCCPWSFDKNVLILNELKADENPVNVDLSRCDFYVHVHDLPLSRMNRGLATFIANWLGTFWDIEMDDQGRAWGATLRIRVSLDVNKPLTRALRIHTTMGEEQLITFTYEGLSIFCCLCGKLGHIQKYCEKMFEEGFCNPGEDTPYGPWLRAPRLQQVQRKEGEPRVSLTKAAPNS
ncbi:UNVERIFIED_CONTAM: hypothetical protein Slati_4271900 [Sesamum latifolium]|uniref:CCHC-type domain-containing protein n=1 Tax=Sesamum latifolium TaxID=2727402 RepID=A0AAW2TDC6_9LAMI